MATRPDPGRPQLIVGTAASTAGIVVTGFGARGTLDAQIAVPLAALCFTMFVALTAWGLVRAKSRGSAGAPLPATGSVLIFVGAVMFIVYLVQPWRSCDYDDVAAGCTVLPADVAGLTAAALVIVLGAGVLVWHAIARWRARPESGDAQLEPALRVPGSAREGEPEK